MLLTMPISLTESALRRTHGGRRIQKLLDVEPGAIFGFLAWRMVGKRVKEILTKKSCQKDVV